MEKQDLLSHRKQNEENAQERFAKIMEMSRGEKRRNLRIRQVVSNRPYARVRSGVRTGTTAHFALWMMELGVKRHLSSIRIDTLADSLDGKIGSTFAILRVSGGFKSVYQLSQAKIERLLSIPQIGPARLAEVEAYFNARNVKMNWTAA